MENQKIKKTRIRATKFTKSEDKILESLLNNTEGSIKERCDVVAKTINKSSKSVQTRYYYLVAHKRMKKIEMPRGSYIHTVNEILERRGKEKVQIPEYESYPHLEIGEAPRAVKKPQEIKTPSKWRRIINILFNK